MLLTETVNKDNSIECTYESSNIVKSVYHPSRMALEIHFKRGGAYEYTPVNPHQHHMFSIAESQGKRFIEYFKNNKTISYRKLG